MIIKDIEKLVKTKSFCILPWTHLYYFNDGYVYPCSSLSNHPEMRLGTVDQTPEEIWNSKKLRELRIKMLSNEEILLCNKECNDCLNSCKKYFGTSLISSASASIVNTDELGYSPFNFIAWNVFESNVCNLQCTYCDSLHSNSWAKKENIVIDNLNLQKIEKIYKNFENVKEVWFSGGETMLMKSTMSFLEKFANINNNIRVRIITNLSTNMYNEKFFSLIKKFNNIIIFGSCDLDGKRGEYIRKNSNFELIKENIKKINQNNIKFYLQPVISIYNIFYIFDFHKRMYGEGLLRKDNIRYYNLHYPEHLRYSILPKYKKDEVKIIIEKYKSWLLEGNELKDFYPNREAPTITLDKIVECMYTGKYGHFGFSDMDNEKYYKKFLNTLIEDKVVEYFKELL